MSYEPPKIWKWDAESGGRFAKINRPIAGPTHEKELPVGEHPFQLYSLATPNGVKVTVMFEELAGPRPRGRRVRRVPRQHRRGEPVLERLRRGQPELEDPGARRPRHGPANAGVRVRRHPPLPGREVRRVPARGPRRPHRVPVLAVLADGQRALPGRRLRPLLRLRPREARVPDQPLHDGGQAPARRAGPPLGRVRVHGRRRVHDRRHGDLALVRGAGRRQALRFRRVHRGPHLRAREPLVEPDRPAPRRQARADGEPRVRPAGEASSANATTPATSRRGRRTRSSRPKSRADLHGTCRVRMRCRPSAGACFWPPAAAADRKVRAPRERPRRKRASVLQPSRRRCEQSRRERASVLQPSRRRCEQSRRKRASVLQPSRASLRAIPAGTRFRSATVMASQPSTHSQ